MSKKKKVFGLVREGRTLLDASKLQEATTRAESALAILPADQAARELRADVAFRQQDLPTVIGILRSLLEQVPNNPIYHNKIAVAYALQSEFETAAIHLRKALRLKPDHLPACLDLCKVATELGEFSEAIQAGLQAVRLSPQNPKVHDHIAMAYEVYGFYNKAREHYEIAARLSPNDGLRQYACGNSFQGVGDKESARQYLEKAIELLPRFVPPYQALARMNRYSSPDHEDFSKLKSLLDDPDLAENNRGVLHFALGKMYEDCELYERAFEHFAAGNRIENRKRHYRPEAYRDLVTRLIESCPAENFSTTSGLGHPSRVPLFIVGMPRSGTTLIEQILACHPDVFGAGELPWFIKCANDLAGIVQSSRPYPECIAELGEKEAQTLGKAYLDYLTSLAGSDHYKYIINKWPNNYERVGLIARIFPNARFIHCQRNPLDNLISQYTLMFPNSVDYSYDLFNLGAHHTQYERLMHHWESVLPRRFFHIQYEELVADQEVWSRKLLDFLDLPWDPACLNFHKSDRVVRTYSDAQVRKPMYSSSVGRWKHYEKFLEPMQRGLRWAEELTDPTSPS
ncbi:MAG: sulfotransferase [Pseudomonadota bacterium]|nr:sulfotransferase [Pseudomonadota bacterium]